MVAHLRRFSSPRLLAALSGCGCEVRVYGLGKRPPVASGVVASTREPAVRLPVTGDA